MSSYLSKSKKDFKPKAPVRRAAATAVPVSSQEPARAQSQSPASKRALPLPTSKPGPSSTVRSNATAYNTEDSSAPAPTHIENTQPSTEASRATRANEQAISPVPSTYQEPLPTTPIETRQDQSDRPRSTLEDPGSGSPRSNQYLATPALSVQSEIIESSDQRTEPASEHHGPIDVEDAHSTADPTAEANCVDQSPSGSRHVEAIRDEVPAEEGASAAALGQGRKRTRKQTIDAAASRIITAATAEPTQKRKRRTKIGNESRARKRRALTPENAETVEIHPSETKMADLCRDPRRGKKSSREVRLAKREEVEQLRKQAIARAELRGFLENPTAVASNPSPDAPAAEEVPTVAVAEEEPTVDSTPTTRLAPSLRIVNGQIVADESSRQIDRQALAAGETLNEEEENPLSRRINSGTHLKRTRNTKWDADMTQRFFHALRMFGTDFGMVATLFPGFSRRQIKLKFTKEERRDEIFMRQVLVHERTVPAMEEVERLSGMEFLDPRVVEEEMASDERELREEAEREKAAAVQVERTRAEEARREAEDAVARKSRGDGDGGGEEEDDEDDEGVEDGSAKENLVVGPKRGGERTKKRAANRLKRAVQPKPRAARKGKVLREGGAP